MTYIKPPEFALCDELTDKVECPTCNGAGELNE
jgi:hypothetical protein